MGWRTLSLPHPPADGKFPRALPMALQSHTRGPRGVAGLVPTQPQSSE